MFLLTALEHDAVTDPVHDLIFAHVTEGKYHPTTIPAKLHRLLLDVLGEATSDEWTWVADTFISQAREALGIEDPLNSTHEAPPHSQTDTRRTLRNLAPKALRAKLAKIVTHPAASLSAAYRGWKATRRIDQQTGISRQQITAADQSRTCPKSKALTEREQVIDTARTLDPMTFDIDTRLATHPGKYEGASDLPLAVALNIIDEHGLPDEIRGDAATRGYAWRVKRFVGVVDLQGFVHSEEYPTLERAIERLQDFGGPDGDGDA
ncbi:MAG: hypothetical protein ACRDLF_08280 [Solirubrobacteraceae bacterium]